MKYGKFSVIVKPVMVAFFVEVEVIISTVCDRYGHTETIFVNVGVVDSFKRKGYGLNGSPAGCYLVPSLQRGNSVHSSIRLFVLQPNFIPGLMPMGID